ncbi:MAG: translocation/assembly module TamB domain-containing protein [candidate division Zixibacteria bacterium]|nr:translocation/assembly module TamB domain-containing protein [candidate division Zixibacteria bacterium]
MRRVFKISLTVISVILFFIALILYLFFFTTVPEQQVNNWLNYYLENEIGCKAAIGKINRDLWGRVRLDSIQLFHVIDSTKATVKIGDIKFIEANYSINSILFNDLSFSDLKIDSINLSLMPENILGKPLKSEQTENPPKKASMPKINIDRFDLTNINIKTLTGDEVVTIDIPCISGSFSSSGELISLGLKELSGNCPQKNFAIESFCGEFSLIENTLLIDSLNIKTSRSQMYLSGNIDKLNDPDFQLSFDFSPLNLEDIKSLSGINLDGIFKANGSINGGIKKFSGRLKGNGTLFERDLEDFYTDIRFVSKILYFDHFKGNVFKAPLSGKGYINFNTLPESYGFEGSIEDLNLQNISPDIYSAFSGKIALKGLGFAESSFRMNIDMDLTKADIDIYHFHQAVGEIEFDINCLTFQPGFIVSYKDTWITLEGLLEYTGSIDLAADVKFYDLANFQNQFFINDLDGSGRAVLSVDGPTEDFNIRGAFQSDSCRFYGLAADSFNVDVDLKSFISHKVGTINGNWLGGDLYSIPVDSGSFSILVSGEKYFLDKVFWENKNNQMYMTGSYDNGSIPPCLVIDTLDIKLWNDTVFCVNPLIIDVYDKEVQFKDFKLFSRLSSLDIAGTVTFEGQMDIDILADELEIQPIVNYFVSDRKITSILSCNIKVGGDFDLPQLSADFLFSNLSIDDVNLGALNITAIYNDSRLTFEPAELKNSSAIYTITGTLPINLSFTTDDERLSNDPISLHLVASGSTIELVPLFVPSVEDFDGDFNIDIAYTGTYDRPNVDGNFLINGGTLKALDLIDPINDISVSGRMMNDSVFIDDLSGFVKSSKGGLAKMLSTGRNVNGDYGKVSGNGTIKILRGGMFDYDLTLSGSGCEFSTEAYDIQGLADIYIDIKGASPPTVNGWVQLIRLDMREPFESFAATGDTSVAEVLEDSTQWDINLDIRAANNMWVKNTEADMELYGDITLTREKGQYNTIGTLEVIRGNFFLWNLKFKVVNGEMIFEDIDEMNPNLNFQVTTKIRGNSETEGIEYTDFNLLITGTLASPEIHTEEGSQYSDDDIISTLINNTITGGGEVITTGNSFADKLIQGAGEYIINLYNPSTQIGLIDELDINPYDKEGNTRSTRISVAKYISPKLFLRYSRLLSEEAEQTFGIEYFFNNNISFEGKQGTRDEGVSLNLKFGYEY